MREGVDGSALTSNIMALVALGFDYMLFTPDSPVHLAVQTRRG